MATKGAYDTALLKLSLEIADLRDSTYEAREVARHLFDIVRELPADLSDLDPYFANIVANDDHWLWD